MDRPFLRAASQGRGGDLTLYADPAPRSLLVFGPEVPDHGRGRRPKEILLLLVEGEKEVFHPMFLQSNYSVFFKRTQQWT